jgi:hypothetical protein
LKRFRTKKIAVLTTAFLVLGGAAFGFWTAGGAGDGTATTGTSADVVITQTSIVSLMGPGIAAQPLSGTFTSAPNPVYVSQVTATVASTSNAGCTASDFTIVQPTATNAEVTTGSTWGGGSIAFNNKPAVNQDACKNVTVNIHYASV